MIYFLILMLAGMVLLAVMANTPAAQLKRMARTLNLRYDKQLDEVLLPDSTVQAQFFRQGLHQFFHVLTFREPSAFMRVCEDRIFPSPLDKKPSHIYTLVTAELLKDNFTPFVLAPREKDIPAGANLPPELAQRYTLSAPEGFALPAQVIGFLKAHPACYVECTQTALIYCEFTTVPPEQLQPLRFRAFQLLKELLKNEPAPAAQAAPQPAAPLAQLSEEELQAHILLKLQSGPHSSAPAAPDSKRYVYGLVLLVLLGSVLFLTWYALSRSLAH